MHKTLTLMLVFGCVYLVSEVSFSAIMAHSWSLKGHTSLWMGLVGGGLGLLLRYIHDNALPNINYKLSVLIGGLSITVMELVAGLILNKWLGFNIWDYSKDPANFMGLICLPMSILWLVITPAAYWLSDVIDHYLLHTVKPYPFIWYYLRVVFPDRWLFTLI